MKDIESRLAALERSRPTGWMVSDAYGSSEVRPVQPGFPAELTSTWSGSTGYSWKQLLLSGVALAADTIPLTGNNAVTPDSNTSLASGTKGWLEPDPQAGGWLFVASSSSDSSWKLPVRVATTTAGTLATSFENGDTVDGVTLVTGDRILIKNQSSAAANGIYTVNASGAPTRATDADSAADIDGAAVSVLGGTANADTVWLASMAGAILGTDAITWKLVGPHNPSLTTSTSLVSLTADDTFYDIVSVSLPGAGTYYIYGECNVNISISAGTGTAWVRLRDTTASATLTQQVWDITYSPGLFGTHISTIVTVTQATTVKLQAQRSSGPTYTASTVCNAGSNTPSSVGFMRVG